MRPCARSRFERVGDCQRARIHGDRRVELVLVRGDTVERLANELVRRDALLLERAPHVADAGFDDRELLCPRC